MGIRFRKVFSLGGLLRLNISKTGIGVGVGPKGLSLSIGLKGIRRSIGIPGSGLSYQDTASWKQLNKVADLPSDNVNLDASAETLSSANSANGVKPWKIVLGLIVAVAFVWYLKAPNQKEVNKSESVVVETEFSNRPLSSTEIRELQTLLNQKGYKTGPIDGVVGPKTGKAVNSYLKTINSKQVTGLDLKLLNQLRK